MSWLIVSIACVVIGCLGMIWLAIDDNDDDPTYTRNDEYPIG